MFRGCFAAACLLAFAGLCGSTVAQSRLCEEYTPTVDGERCTPEDTSCEFKLVVTRKFAVTKADGTRLFVDNYKVYRSVIICMKYVYQTAYTLQNCRTVRVSDCRLVTGNYEALSMGGISASYD